MKLSAAEPEATDEVFPINVAQPAGGAPKR
jgi:hypothetical protein